MDNLIGKRLDGRYQITELVGMGGMANVYKAADMLENRTVAVKILRDEFLDNEELVRRFKNESKAIGLLSHPNIVKVLDVSFSNSVQYIVMEYIDGITLKQYIDTAKPLGWKDTVHFTVQILRALQHAHDRGIVHRDIKPQNIMLVEDGSIKVMDFGIARFSRSETRTITDKAIGSVHYISPEQAKGDITDSKADIYSVGIMMYEMLTGMLPFDSDTAVQVAIKQISDQATRPRMINESIPEGLEEITLKAMSKDPAQRYQSAAQMLRDIDDFKKNPSIVFEYKYFSDNAATKYIDRSKLDSKSLPSKSARSATASGKSPQKKKKPSKRPKISTYLIIGIVSACIMCTVVLALFMIGAFEGRYDDVPLPDFRNKNIEDILNDPAYKSFKFETREEFNTDKDIGVVYDQDPMPGRTVKENSRVTLYVSKGAQEVTLMNVVGMTSGEAKQVLKGLGVRVNVIPKADPTKPANIVLEMSPAADSVVLTDSEVTIYVNMLEIVSSTEVPDLLGRSLTEAYNLLSEANLRRGKVDMVTSNEPYGTVIAQSMPKGTKVAIDTAIDLTVSKGPEAQTYSNVSFSLPNGPLDGGVPQTYDVIITVDGAGHQSFQNTNAGNCRINTFTVTHDNTKIRVYLRYNSVDYEYMVFNASNKELRCTVELDKSQNTWPFSARAPMDGYSGVHTAVVPHNDIFDPKATAYVTTKRR